MTEVEEFFARAREQLDPLPECSKHGAVQKSLFGHTCDECENISVAGFQKTQDALLEATDRLIAELKKHNEENK